MLGITIPISQLRTSTVVVERCCCPDPAFCHCPKHDPAPGPAPTMESCGSLTHLVVAPVLPMFEPPPDAVIVAVATTPAPELPLRAPHAPPDPARPAAPS